MKAFPRRDGARIVRMKGPRLARGRRECRVSDAPAASRAKGWHTSIIHHRFTGFIRHSLRDGLRLISRSPRGTGLDSPRRGPIILDPLDPSLGGSGPRDFAVRVPARSPCARPHVHRIPLPTSVTMAIRPSRWKRNRTTIRLICVSGKAKYFSIVGLTRCHRTSPSGKSAVRCKPDGAAQTSSRSPCGVLMVACSEGVFAAENRTRGSLR